MAYISSRVLRAILPRPFLFLLFVGLLALLPALFDTSVQAIDKQGARTPELSKIDAVEIEDEMRSVEIEYDNYLALMASDSRGSRAPAQANEIKAQLLSRIVEAKGLLRNSTPRARAHRDAWKRITLLEKTVKQETLPIGKQARRAAGSLKSGKLAPAATGAISGTVIDAATMNPISGVTVQIFAQNSFLVATAVTNGSGNYVTTVGLETGTYFARTNNNLGYVNEQYNNITCAPCSVTLGNPISVTDGATTTGINFALAVGGQISGNVINAATSAPLTGVNVRIFNSLGQQVISVNSVAGGNYSVLTGLPAGTYYARAFSSQGFISQSYTGINCTTCTPTLGAPITVTAGATTTGINFALAAGGRITGTVIDNSTAMPVPGVLVQIVAPSGALITSVITNASGVYTTAQGLPTGTYFARTMNDLAYKEQVYANDTCVEPCDVTSGVPISVTAGLITTGINFFIEPGASIGGTVTDSVTSAPIEGVEVDIWDFEGRFITFGITDDMGNYLSFSGLSSDSAYFATTFSPTNNIDELYDNITCAFCDILTGTIIVVASGETTTVDFALDVGGTVSGTVTDSATTLPLAGMTVQIFDSSGAFVASAITDIAGSYSTSPGLPTGTYYARATNILGYIPELYNNIPCPTCDVLTGTSFSVTAGSTTPGINFSLDTGGRIFGAVNDISNQTSILGARVEFYNSGGTLVGISISSTQGNYNSPALPAGTYFARTTNTRGFLDKLYNDIPCAGCAVTGGNPVTVSAGAVTADINFALCSYALSQKSILVSARGGERSLSVTASGTCAWTATSNDAWIEITSEASGTGNGTFNYLVRDNTGLSSRAGTITVGGSTFTIFQSGRVSCSANLSPSTPWRFGTPGGEGIVHVSAGAGCAWQVESNVNWIVIVPPPRGIGNATLTFVVMENTTGLARDGVITSSSGKKVAVKQK